MTKITRFKFGGMRLALCVATVGALAVVGTSLAVSSNFHLGAAQTRRSTDPPMPPRGKLGQDLFLAIDHRDAAGVQALLDKGADPNSTNGLGFVPLYIAAASHQDDVVHALIKAGAK